MKILIIGDSHGNIANLKVVMEAGKKANIDAIIHAGDWDNLESVEAVLSFGIPLYAVLGNADVDPEIGKRLKVKGKRFAEDFLEINLNGRKIGITHRPSDNKKFFVDKKLDLIINGHLHSKYESKVTPVRIIRPGALIKGIFFAVYDTEANSDTKSGKIEFVEDEERF